MLFAYSVLIACVGFSSVYSWHLLLGTAVRTSSIARRSYERIHADSMIMLLPLLALFFGTLAVGYVFLDSFCGVGSHTFAPLHGEVPSAYAIASLSVPRSCRLLPPCIALVVLAGYGLKTLRALKLSAGLHFSSLLTRASHRTAALRCHWDFVYAHCIIRPGLAVALLLCRHIDSGWLQHFGAHGFHAVAANSMKFSASMHSGKIAIHLASFAGALAL